jgi:hypothetical protein
VKKADILNRPLRALRCREAACLGAANDPRSTLARMSELVLLTTVFQEHLNGEISSQRLARLAVIESLCAHCPQRKSALMREALAGTREAIELNKNRRYQTPAPWKGMILDCAIVKELFVRVARSPGGGSSTGRGARPPR